ncbi:MAG: UTP--glucose-1-phosphate uridylyltransferase GalU [Clostridia bacterium]|nr:MAG: UTP--glucose-1-phosphate uridylyltransferase GalU [Clostridia bacterium]
MKQVRKAVIPAAGLGTRFLPATKAQPKEMLPVVDKPAIQYIVEEAVACGLEDILIITGRNKRAIEDHFDHSLELEAALAEKDNHEALENLRRISEMADIHYIRQKEPRGLGHAIYCARKFIGQDPFAVLLADDLIVTDGSPCLQQLLDIYETRPGNIIAIQQVLPEEVNKYGIVEGQALLPRLYQVSRLVEKPPVGSVSSNLAIVGRYILQPEIFTALAEVAPGAGGEIQLTDAIGRLLGPQPVYAYLFQGRRFDVGDKLGFLQATIEMALMRPDLRDELGAYLRGTFMTDSRLAEVVYNGGSGGFSGGQEL